MFTTGELALSDAVISARGAKSCPLSDTRGEKVFFQIGSKASPTSTPFGASSFNDEPSARKTLDLRLTTEQDEAWNAFDAWAVQYLTEQSERLFKKAMSREQVREHYRSPVSRKEGYQATLRCKINTSGRAEVRAWDVEGDRAALPADLRGYDLAAKVHASHLWVMGRDFGWVFNVTDLQISGAAADTACPFAFGG